MASTQRPAQRRPLSPVAGDDASVSAVIGEFLGELGAGADRELRSALNHVDAELGPLPIADVRPRQLTGFLDDLRRAGLSERRQAIVGDALDTLFAYAVARRLVAVNPLPGGPSDPVPSGPSDPLPRGRSDPPPATGAPTPTFTMLAVGTRLVGWLTWMIVAGFVALLALLLVELG